MWQRWRQSPGDNNNSGPPSCAYPADSVVFNNASPATPLLQTVKTQHVNYNRQIINPPLHLFVCFYSTLCGWKPLRTDVWYSHFSCSRGSMCMQIVFTRCHKKERLFLLQSITVSLDPMYVFEESENTNYIQTIKPMIHQSLQIKSQLFDGNIIWLYGLCPSIWPYNPSENCAHWLVWPSCSLHLSSLPNKAGSRVTYLTHTFT